jgi:hypothetical protein
MHQIKQPHTHHTPTRNTHSHCGPRHATYTHTVALVDVQRSNARESRSRESHGRERVTVARESRSRCSPNMLYVSQQPSRHTSTMTRNLESTLSLKVQLRSCSLVLLLSRSLALARSLTQHTHTHTHTHSLTHTHSDRGTCQQFLSEHFRLQRLASYTYHFDIKP